MANTVCHIICRLDMIAIRGKRRRPVCAILTPDTKTALDLLVKSRRLVGISKENKFLFPRATGKSCLRGDKCLRDLASEADLEHPERIGSTNMRKYIATVVQVMYSYMVTYKRHILKPSNCLFSFSFFVKRKGQFQRF